jgi:hypothetical protein
VTLLGGTCLTLAGETPSEEARRVPRWAPAALSRVSFASGAFLLTARPRRPASPRAPWSTRRGRSPAETADLSAEPSVRRDGPLLRRGER